jgi:hypothetical protein
LILVRTVKFNVSFDPNQEFSTESASPPTKARCNQLQHMGEGKGKVGARSIVKETMYMPFTDNPLKELACTVDSSLIFFVIWHVHISFVKWKYLIFNPAKILIIKIHWSVEYIIIFIGYCFGFFFFEHISTKKNSN